MRVLLVEDSEFVRTQFLRLFEGLDFVEVVGYADSEEDAVQAVAVLKPDVVLLDLNLQVGSGMHVLSRARAGGYTGKLWVLSSRDPDFYRSLCEKHGADGFYDKANDQDQLVADLRALSQ